MCSHIIYLHILLLNCQIEWLQKQSYHRNIGNTCSVSELWDKVAEFLRKSSPLQKDPEANLHLFKREIQFCNFFFSFAMSEMIDFSSQPLEVGVSLSNKIFCGTFSLEKVLSKPCTVVFSIFHPITKVLKHVDFLSDDILNILVKRQRQ